MKLKKFWVALALTLLSVYPNLSAQVVINEILSSNEDLNSDEDGDFEDWIELYNTGNEAVQLEGYWLSDDFSNLNMWQFPEQLIQPNEHLLVFASGKNRVSSPLHTNFKISSLGETLFLSNPSLELIDSFSAESLASNHSYGRSADGHESKERLETPTPGSSNNLGNNLIFSTEAGFYENPIDLLVSSTNSGDIRYTTDGSQPTVDSQLFIGSLYLTSIEDEGINISSISSSPSWSEPQEIGFRAHAINFGLFIDGELSSKVYSKTYFIDPEVHSKFNNLEVVSLVLDSLSLFDYNTGIYVQGVNYSSSDATWSGNYFERGDDWEREAHVSFFSEAGTLELEQEIGVRIHGGKSRNLPQKSLRLISRPSYNAPRFNGKLFETKDKEIYKKLVLRNTMSSWRRTMITDECTSYITRNLDFDTYAAKPKVVFINGEYWGFYALREHFDENYLIDSYGIDDDESNIVLHGSGNRDGVPDDWGTVHGSNEEHILLYEFLNDNSLSVQENFDYVATQLNMESILDYYCSQVYFNNKDWPTNNNKLWNSEDDPRWRQVFYDLDGGWNYLGTNYNLLERALSENGFSQNAPYATFLFRKLMENSFFQDLYLHRMACLMNNEFSADAISEVIDQHKLWYEGDLQTHINRWNFPSSPAAWSNDISSMESFAYGRKQAVINHVEEVLNVNFNPDEIDCATPPLSIDSMNLLEKELNLVVYPNPSENGRVRVAFNELNQKHNTNYIIYNSLGQIVKTGTILPYEEIPYQFQSGISLITFEFDGELITKKIVVP